MRINKSTMLSEIKLGEAQDVPSTVQILRVGKFNHPQYGYFEITAVTLAEMKSNFDQKIRGVDICFDYYHASDEDASAWVKSLELRENNSELWAEVDWTPKARQKLAERELRYFSPDFTFQWEDPESGAKFSNVLFGGGLTNRPFVKEMAAIVADEKLKEELQVTELETTKQTLKLAEAKVLKLSDELAEKEKKMADMAAPETVEQLKQQISELQAKLAKAEADSATALAEKKKSDEAKALAEKESAFNVLLSEGKAVVAQKEAFLANDMTKFIALAQPLNLKGQGSSHSVDKTEQAKVDSIIKLAESKVKANPKLSYGDAMSEAKKEIEKQ